MQHSSIYTHTHTNLYVCKCVFDDVIVRVKTDNAIIYMYGWLKIWNKYERIDVDSSHVNWLGEGVHVCALVHGVCVRVRVAFSNCEFSTSICNSFAPSLPDSLSLPLALAPSVKSPCRDAQNHSCHLACSMQAQLSHRGARAASTCPLLLPWQAPQNWRSPTCQTTVVRRWNCLGATPPRRGIAAAGQLYCRDAWCADMQWPVLMWIHTHTHVCYTCT